jgi:hypothetical protein
LETLAFFREPSRRRRGSSAGSHTPRLPWFAHSLASRPVSALRRFYQAGHRTDKDTAKCPESLRPLPVLPPWERRVPPPERTLLLRHSYYELMRQTRLALLYFDSTSRLRSPCKLLPAPAASGLFPTLALRIFPMMPGPPITTVGRLHIPGSSSATAAFPTETWVGIP